MTDFQCFYFSLGPLSARATGRTGKSIDEDMMPSVPMQRQSLQPRPALPRPCRSAPRQNITCRLVSTRRAVLGVFESSPPHLKASSSCNLAFTFTSPPGVCNNYNGAGSLCGCGLCQGRLRWYDRYFAWNMANFEEQYEGLIGSRKADLFADFLPSKGQERIQLVDIGAGTLPNSRYYKVSMHMDVLQSLCNQP